MGIYEEVLEDFPHWRRRNGKFTAAKIIVSAHVVKIHVRNSTYRGIIFGLPGTKYERWESHDFRKATMQLMEVSEHLCVGIYFRVSG